MTKKIILPIFLVSLFIIGFFIFGVTGGNLEEFLFDQIPYNYTSYASIPPNSPQGSSLGGYYKINGKGRNFNFHIVLPGAEKYEHEICYTKEGLIGNGKIDEIDVTYKTIFALLSGDLKKAMFETDFSGSFDMVCASWHGGGNFSNDNGNFTGTFKIIGAATDWEGKFVVVPENNRIAILADYIYYPHNQKSPEKIKKVNKTFYL